MTNHFCWQKKEAGTGSLPPFAQKTPADSLSPIEAETMAVSLPPIGLKKSFGFLPPFLFPGKPGYAALHRLILPGIGAGRYRFQNVFWIRH